MNTAPIAASVEDLATDPIVFPAVLIACNQFAPELLDTLAGEATALAAGMAQTVGVTPLEDLTADQLHALRRTAQAAAAEAIETALASSTEWRVTHRNGNHTYAEATRYDGLTICVSRCDTYTLTAHHGPWDASLQWNPPAVRRCGGPQ
jgi:hypothetical protein